MNTSLPRVTMLTGSFCSIRARLRWCWPNSMAQAALSSKCIRWLEPRRSGSGASVLRRVAPSRLVACGAAAPARLCGWQSVIVDRHQVADREARARRRGPPADRACGRPAGRDGGPAARAGPAGCAPTQAALKAAACASSSSCSCCSRVDLDAPRAPAARRRGGRRARAGAVLEGEGLGEADLLDQPHGRREVGVALAGKADDEVGRQRQVGPRRAQRVDEAAIVVGGVAAVHRLEHRIGARLHRQVQERHQLRQVAMGADQLRVHVARVRGRVAQPRQARDLGQRAQQPGQAPGARRPGPRRGRR